ncbi:hypothetical protein BSKO_13733 [Bryopsis sp. KO-2023]|nr:hypothetical protein BSKO_13733 [Bryopsis sp. KO-2023]
MMHERGKLVLGFAAVAAGVYLAAKAAYKYWWHEEDVGESPDDVGMEPEVEKDEAPAESPKSEGLVAVHGAHDIVEGDSRVSWFKALVQRYAIGCGAFGRIMAVTDPFTQDHYALKRITLDKLDDYGRVAVERELWVGRFWASRQAFLCPTLGGFRDQLNLYLVTPFAEGRSLENIVQELNFNMTRFICAQVLIALEHLHQVGITHRDVKLENVFLDASGYLMLGDFGLSAEQGADYTPGAGTLEYLPTEAVLDPKKHTPEFEAPGDIWSWGVLLYKCITHGRTPFSNSAGKILKGRIRLANWDRRPETITPVVMELLNSIFKKDPSVRPSPREIAEHEFFDGFDWEALKARAMPSPLLHEEIPMLDLGEVGPTAHPHKYFALGDVEWVEGNFF